MIFCTEPLRNSVVDEAARGAGPIPVPRALPSGGVMARRLFEVLVLLLALCSLGGCRGDLSIPDNPGSGGARGDRRLEDRRGLSFESLDHGTWSGIREPLRAVIRDQAAWQELWARHVAGRPTPPPPVDFTREMVIAFFLGERPESGWQVTVRAVVLLLDHITVEMGLVAPAAGAMVSQVLTQPHHLVKVARHDVPVDFRVVERPPQPGF